MKILCSFGLHAWGGCECSRCGKTRDQEHAWNGCKCKRCGKTRDTEHDWTSNCRICSRCNTAGTGTHDFGRDHRRCSKCGQRSSWKRTRDPGRIIIGVADDLWSWPWAEKNRKLDFFGAHQIQDFTAGCAARGYDTAVDFFSELVKAYPTNGLVWWCLGWAIQARQGTAHALQAFNRAAGLGWPLVKALPDGSVKVKSGFGEWWLLSVNGDEQLIEADGG